MFRDFFLETERCWHKFYASTDAECLKLIFQQICQQCEKGAGTPYWCILSQSKNYQLEMWANAQRDGRPAEYSWRPLFNAATFGWRPLLQPLLKCRAVTLRRLETRWNRLGCPKLPDRSQPLVGRSSPYCGESWRRYCCCFFPIIDVCFNWEDMARQIC